MTLRVIGAGFGRTGTASLKLALERLLGQPCYHMLEVFSHPEHVAVWHDAALGSELPEGGQVRGGARAEPHWATSGAPALSRLRPSKQVRVPVWQAGPT